MSSVEATSVSLRIRDYIEPLFVIHAVQVCGSRDDLLRIPAENEPDGQPQNDIGRPPSDWRARGSVIMSEERLPEAAHALKVAVLQRLHPEAPPVLLSKSPVPTKLWAELDIFLNDVQLSYGPSFVPALNIISLVVAGLTPQTPSEGDTCTEPPKIPSWDQARLMAHGKVRLHIDRGILRLLADRSPYNTAECFQLRGQPVTISYDINDSSDGSGKDRGDKEDAAQDKDEAAPEKQEVNEHARKHGRVHIGSQMVEWSVISQAREMASYMLLNKPLFKARKMSISISLHWKCQGSAFAHHLTRWRTHCRSR